MTKIRPTGLSRTALLASAVLMLASGVAPAQTVRVFDEAPTLEQLRSIIVPESRPGAGRTIVMPRPDYAARAAPVQRATIAMPLRAEGAMADTAAPARPAQARPMPVSTAPLSTAPLSTPPLAQPPGASAVWTPAPRMDRQSTPNPAPAAEAPAPGIVGFHINFAFNSAALPASATTMIDRVADLLLEEPQVRLRVEGHTDATGSAAYNEDLSERRAASVAAYLVKRGVAPARLILIGKGMAEPLAEDRFAPENRRVQFVRVG